MKSEPCYVCKRASYNLRKCSECAVVGCWTCVSWDHKNQIPRCINHRSSQAPSWKPIKLTKKQKEKNAKIKKMKSLYSSIKEGDPFDLELSVEIFLEMVKFILGEQDLEISGFGREDEGKMHWAFRSESDRSSGGDVTAGSGSATVAAIIAGIDLPNVQWHTHPGFGAFFSATDINDHIKFLKDAMDTSNAGHIIFICVSELDWQMVRFDWADGVLVKRKGAVIIDGVKLDYRRAGRAVHQPSVGSQWYGNGYYDDEIDPVLLALPSNAQDYNIEVEPKIKSGDYLKGRWSDQDEDYLPLFEIYKVEPYDWEKLFDEIEVVENEIFYYEIVDDKNIWPLLPNLAWSDYYEQTTANEPTGGYGL